jgi:hypothetical protein
VPSFKLKLALILACLGSCAPASSAVAGTYSASSLMAAYPAWALSAAEYLAYALAVIGGGYLIHWYSERRYIAGRVDYHSELASMAVGKATRP